MTEIRMEPIGDASAWQGAELEADRSWEYVLNEAHLAELEHAFGAVKQRQLGLLDITRAAFVLPTLGKVLERIADDLRTGRGFALLRGFPVHAYPFDELELLYWGLCSHIGVGLTQNSQAGFIHYVTDGALRPKQGKRAVGLPKESLLHVDLMDVVSLLCVRQAPDDPPSRVASSSTIYNEILRRRPDVLARLYDGFEWDRMDEHGEAESATSGYRVPVYSQTNGVVSCRYNRNWINSAAVRKDCPHSPDDNAILDLIDEVAFETCFEFPFHAGDIQFCNNYTVMHGRAAHQVVREEDQKRVLMRIWLDLPEFRQFADEALVRYGIGRHGQLGWTAEDVRRGRNRTARSRQSDGVIALA